MASEQRFSTWTMAILVRDQFQNSIPIGQSVIDAVSVTTAAFPLRCRGVPVGAPIEQVGDDWRVFTCFPADPTTFSRSAYSLFMIKGMQLTAYAVQTACASAMRSNANGHAQVQFSPLFLSHYISYSGHVHLT